MGKGLSLEQFKEQLETDATKRCAAQEKSIKELHETLKNRDEYIAALKHRIITLENKCYVGTRGVLCIFCTDKGVCKAHGRKLWKG